MSSLLQPARRRRIPAAVLHRAHRRARTSTTFIPSQPTIYEEYKWIFPVTTTSILAGIRAQYLTAEEVLHDAELAHWRQLLGSCFDFGTDPGVYTAPDVTIETARDAALDAEAGRAAYGETIALPPVAGYTIYLNGSALTTMTLSDGTHVSEVQNLAAGYSPAEQSDTTMQPTTAGSINSVGALRFDGVDDYLLISDFGLIGSAYTCYVVGEWQGGGGGRVVAFSDATGTGTDYVPQALIALGNGATWYSAHDVDTKANATGQVVNTPQYATTRYDGQHWDGWLNGVAMDSGADDSTTYFDTGSDPAFPPLGQVLIGAGIEAGIIVGQSQTDVGLVLFYPTAHTDAQVDATHVWITAHFGF